MKLAKQTDMVGYEAMLEAAKKRIGNLADKQINGKRIGGRK